MTSAIKTTVTVLCGLALVSLAASCRNTPVQQADAHSGATPAYDPTGRATLPPEGGHYEVLGVTEGIKNWVIRYDERLLRGGEFYSERAAESLGAWGVKTVISISPNDSERALCRKHGLRLVEIPFDTRTGPSRADLERFLETLRSGKGPFYAHCVGGSHRGGVLGVAYRVHVLHWPWDKALIEYGRLGGDLKADHAMLEAVRPAPPTAAVPEAVASGLQRPDYQQFSQAAAVKFNTVAKRRAIVYSRLAEFLVARFDLAERHGIGIDIGGGPGDLVFELAQRTKQFYWVNADINTWYAQPFSEDALKRGVAHRTGFVFADANALPFKDRYADLVVSRGSYQFWPDVAAGLREVHRVLRPGGQAFIGRGFPPTMPEQEVRSLRAGRLVGGPKYDPDTDAAAFQAVMQKLGVQEFEVIRHTPSDASINYGVWLRFRKNAGASNTRQPATP